MNEQLMNLAAECGAETGVGWVKFHRPEQLEAFAQRIREDERERCASVCEAESEGHRMAFGEHCAAAIRRGGDHG